MLSDRPISPPETKPDITQLNGVSPSINPDIHSLRPSPPLNPMINRPISAASLTSGAPSSISFVGTMPVNAPAALPHNLKRSADQAGLTESVSPTPAPPNASTLITQDMDRCNLLFGPVFSNTSNPTELYPGSIKFAADIVFVSGYPARLKPAHASILSHVLFSLNLDIRAGECTIVLLLAKLKQSRYGIDKTHEFVDVHSARLTWLATYNWLQSATTEGERTHAYAMLAIHSEAVAILSFLIQQVPPGAKIPIRLQSTRIIHPSAMLGNSFFPLLPAQALTSDMSVTLLPSNLRWKWSEISPLLPNKQPLNLVYAALRMTFEVVKDLPGSTPAKLADLEEQVKTATRKMLDLLPNATPQRHAVTLFGWTASSLIQLQTLSDFTHAHTYRMPRGVQEALVAVAQLQSTGSPVDPFVAHSAAMAKDVSKRCLELQLARASEFKEEFDLVSTPGANGSA